MREAFRDCLRQAPYQRQAFEHATAFLRRHEPRLQPSEARALVARMLAIEPPAAEPTGSAAILIFPAERLPPR